LQNSGYFSMNELRHILHSYGVEIYENDLELVFRRYNHMGDGMLKFGEFASLLLPFDQQFSRMLSNRPSKYK